VWAHYRVGQCDDKEVSEQWLRAAEAAIGYVAKAEGKPLREIEAEALAYFGYANLLLKRGVEQLRVRR
jgi:hypothetical protein